MSTLLEAKWDTAARKAYKQSHPDNFAGDGLDYPIKDANDVKDAWDLARGPDQDAIRSRVKAIAKRLGLTSALPDTAKEESAATLVSSTVKPKQKIATLKVCFLEDNARSLNGRIYPKSTVDRILASAIKKLADPNALPVTCFVSHETANSNSNVELVGRVTKVWRESSKVYAFIDLADTRVARDMLALAEGGYMRSESMRVMGVELIHDRDHDLPLVIPQEGFEPELMGIDLTTKPGLQDTARIQQILYESQQDTWGQPYTEEFTLTDVTIETQKGQAESMRIPLYLKAILGSHLEEAMTADRQAHQKVHDHLAGVLDATIAAKHGEESASLIALVESELSEEGRALAKQHALKIAAAHDESAKQLGMDCEGAYNANLGIALDPDQDGIPDAIDPADQKDGDGDDDNNESASSPSAPTGEEDMTPEEMMEALKAQGYTVATPKSADELLEERIQAAVDAKLKALNLTESATPNETPQRKTQVASTLSETQGLQREEIYEDGDYLKGDLKPQNWKSLADRRVPWPKDIDPALALHELAPFLTHRLLQQESEAQGRALSDFIGAHENI